METKKNNNWQLMAAFSFFFIGLTYAVSDHPFFWDTIQLASKQAQWYYDHHFAYLLVPNEFDSGHPPLFGLYLATAWKVFGKTLLVSHFAMLPFLLGIAWQSIRIAHFFVSPKNLIWASIFLLSDATLLAQSSLVSPDILLIFFFLLALNSIVRQQSVWLGVAVLFLSMISLRGMMVVVLLFIIDTFVNLRFYDFRSFLYHQIVLLFRYLPAAFISLAFLSYHYLQKGWIGYHPDSPWAASFQVIDASDFLYHVGIIIWRMIDFGRVAMWAILPFLIWHSRWTKKSKILLFALVASLLVLSPSLIIHKHLSAHRYLLPIFLIAQLLFLQLLDKSKWKHTKVLFMIALVSMLSGNLWVYPHRIAQGWDASLAYLPYVELQREAMDYIENEKLDPASIGSHFPNLASQNDTELNGKQTQFSPLDLTKNSYVMYSNVYNDFSDTEIDELEQHWKIIKIFRTNRIFIILYQRGLRPF